MPVHATSDLEIAQRACILAGMNRIDAFEQADSTEATVLNSIYEDVVRDALTSTRWNFATARKELASRREDAPLTEFKAAYSYLGDDADDVLQINTVWVNGSVVDYDVNEHDIYLDCNAADTVTMGFTKRVPEQFWPPFFTMYVTLRLAAVLAASIVRNAGMAEAFQEQAAVQLRDSRARDSQQVTARKIRLNRFQANRFAGGAR
jgi:hypothetical protein